MAECASDYESDSFLQVKKRFEFSLPFKVQNLAAVDINRAWVIVNGELFKSLNLIDRTGKVELSLTLSSDVNFADADKFGNCYAMQGSTKLLKIDCNGELETIARFEDSERVVKSLSCGKGENNNELYICFLPGSASKEIAAEVLTFDGRHVKRLEANPTLSSDWSNAEVCNTGVYLHESSTEVKILYSRPNPERMQYTRDIAYMASMENLQSSFLSNYIFSNSGFNPSLNPQSLYYGRYAAQGSARKQHNEQLMNERIRSCSACFDQFWQIHGDEFERCKIQLAGLAPNDFLYWGLAFEFDNNGTKKTESFKDIKGVMKGNAEISNTGSVCTGLARFGLLPDDSDTMHIDVRNNDIFSASCKEDADRSHADVLLETLLERSLLDTSLVCSRGSENSFWVAHPLENKTVVCGYKCV